MKFSVEKYDNTVILELQENRLNSLTAPKLKSEFLFFNAEGYKNIILNLEEVEYVDSSGLSAILVGNRVCKDADGSFVLTGLHDNVKKLIKISQLDGILSVVPTVSEGEDYVKMEELERELKK
ncbi:MAG: STAS domain-containing protein [Chitinophagales bacterium]|nr:STAS domain-containing protein [Chitinophagales bacterium]